MYRLGFIDEDAGQRNQFHQTFKDDFEIYNIETAAGDTVERLIGEALTNHVDLLLIDYQMSDVLGFNGDSIARKLEEMNPHFPVMILTSFEDEALDFVDDANKVYGKNIWSGDDEAELQVFKKKLKTLINSYNKRVVAAETELESLKSKKEAEGLESNEEEKYIELNIFMEEVAGKGGHLPRTLYSQETNEKLDELIDKTEQLLDRLTK
jgi:CheY-like chemotaxis protein